MAEKQPKSTEVVEVDRDEAVNPLALAEQNFPEAEREAIAKFIGVGAKDPAFMPYLGIAAHLGLSPLTGEIWLIKGRREENGQWVDFYRPAVGRDGLLKYARRQPNFKGLRYGVVCANDTFEFEDDGWETKVLHRPASLNAANAERGKESRYRGAPIGAWAKLFFKDDRPPEFYFAPSHEHVRTKVKDGEREMVGAWGYTSAMLIKSAVSYVCRLAFGITGVVPFDELAMDDPQMSGAARDEHQAGEAPANLGEDPAEANNAHVSELEISEDLKITLIQALDAVNDLAPFTWTPSKLKLKLGPSSTEEEAQAILAEVEAEFKVLRKRATEREEQEAAEAVEDAIVVMEAQHITPGSEIRVAGSEDPTWYRVEDAIEDDDEGRMALKVEPGESLLLPLDQEVEVRPPPPEDGAGDDSTSE